MLSEGELVDEYRVVRLIGSGPNGVVYRVVRAGRELALKVVAEPDPSRAEALVVAARRAMRLDVPGVTKVVDVGRDEERVWIASELAPGKTLGALLEERGAFGVKAAVEVALGVCRPLERLHRAGAFHGDLKPGNVFIDGDGTVTLTDVDLGRARSLDYASPEASHGYPEDARSDLYSLGVLACQMLTGEPWRHADDEAVVLPGEVPATVRAVIVRLLHKDRSSRFRSAGDVAEALRGRTIRRTSGGRALRVAVMAGLALGAFLILRGRPERKVIVNGTQVSSARLAELEARFGGHILDGRYWYDRSSGAWGLEGSPARCVTEPGLELGAALVPAPSLGARAPHCPLGEISPEKSSPVSETPPDQRAPR